MFPRPGYVLQASARHLINYKVAVKTPASRIPLSAEGFIPQGVECSQTRSRIRDPQADGQVPLTAFGGRERRRDGRLMYSTFFVEDHFYGMDEQLGIMLLGVKGSESVVVVVVVVAVAAAAAVKADSAKFKGVHT